MNTRLSTLIIIVLTVFFFDAYALKAQEKEGRNGNNMKPATVELADEPAVVIGGVRITLAQAIRQAIQQNYDILAGSYDVAMSDTYYEQFQKKYSIFLNAEGGYKYQKNIDAQVFAYGEKYQSLDTSVSLAKMFDTGTTVAAGVSHTYMDKTPQSYDPSLLTPTQLEVLSLFGGMMGPNQYNMPVLFVGVQQELLKNGFGYNERRQAKILKNVGKMQKDQIVSMLSMVVVGVIADYWTVVLNKTQLDNAELQLQETKKVRNIVVRNVNLGLADGFNVNYYNLLVAGAEASVISARQKYQDALRTFLTTVNLGEDVNVAGSAVFGNVMPGLDEESALKTAYEKRADFRNALLAVENARLELEMLSRDAMPSLTAELNMSTMSQNENFGGAYGDAASFKYPSIEARVKMTYPLDDREQVINERNARFKMKQAQINLDKTRRTVRDDIKSKMEAVNTAHELYKKASEAHVQAEAFYYKMLQSLQRGRLSSADVKNGLDAMVSSRQQELTALVYFNVSMLQFEVAKNELFERYEINVDDYIPKDTK